MGDRHCFGSHHIVIPEFVHKDLWERARWSRGDIQWRGRMVATLMFRPQSTPKGGYSSCYFAIAALPWNRRQKPKKKAE